MISMYPKNQMSQASAAKPSAAAPEAPSRHPRSIQVRRSGVHGRGVYATTTLECDQRIIEYKGELITWKEALRRHPHDPANPDHTFYFHLDDQHVIDGKVGGNSSRWINHACQPNCEAEDDNGRVYIRALRDIHPGEELFFDYGLVLEGRHTAKVKKQFECHCGSPQCRGTMLAPKR